MVPLSGDVIVRGEPAVLDNLYPIYDRAGNKMQRIRVRFYCGHVEESLHLDLGKGWKPRSKRQILEDELRITCPLAWKVCRKCAEVAEDDREQIALGDYHTVADSVAQP